MDRSLEKDTPPKSQEAVEAVINQRVVFPLTPHVVLREVDPVEQALYETIRDQSYSDHDQVARPVLVINNNGENL